MLFLKQREIKVFRKSIFERKSLLSDISIRMKK